MTDNTRTTKKQKIFNVSLVIVILLLLFGGAKWLAVSPTSGSTSATTYVCINDAGQLRLSENGNCGADRKVKLSDLQGEQGLPGVDGVNGTNGANGVAGPRGSVSGVAPAPCRPV